KVIVTASAKNVRELVELISQKASSDERVWKRAEDKLNFHPFQTKMLYEIYEQVRAFTQYAHNRRQDRTRNAYFKAQKIIEGIIKSKTLFNEQVEEEDVVNDPGVQIIREYAYSLNKKGQ